MYLPGYDLADITSDCGAVSDVENAHHYFNTSGATVAGVLSAGMDQDCGDFMRLHLAGAIADGSVGDATVTAALRNMLRVRMRLGLFDPQDKQPYAQYSAKDVDTPEARELALEAARQGMVLLKRKDNTSLPLDPTTLRTLALIGCVRACVCVCLRVCVCVCKYASLPMLRCICKAKQCRL